MPKISNSLKLLQLPLMGGEECNAIRNSVLVLLTFYGPNVFRLLLNRCFIGVWRRQRPACDVESSEMKILAMPYCIIGIFPNAHERYTSR